MVNQWGRDGNIGSGNGSSRSAAGVIIPVIVALILGAGGGYGAARFLSGASEADIVARDKRILLGVEVPFTSVFSKGRCFRTQSAQHGDRIILTRRRHERGCSRVFLDVFGVRLEDKKHSEFYARRLVWEDGSWKVAENTRIA